ncbi:MAG: hypothetical protein V1855_00215, partial [bacterium]
AIDIFTYGKNKHTDALSFISDKFSAQECRIIEIQRGFFKSGTYDPFKNAVKTPLTPLNPEPINFTEDLSAEDIF